MSDELSASEVQAQCGLSLEALRQARRRGRLHPCRQEGSGNRATFYYRRSEVEAYIASKETWKVPKQIAVEFDPTLLPTWAQDIPEVVALCAADLSYRVNAINAENPASRVSLIRRAQERGISMEEYERYAK